MFIDARSQKYSIAKAFIKQELVQADKDSGDIVLKDTEEMHRIMKEISDKCTKIIYISMSIRIGKDFMYNRGLFYWDKIYSILDKYFKAGDHYIPAVISLQLLQAYKDKGYSDFNDYDFTDLLGKFEKFNSDKEHRKLISKHFRCAIEIVETLDKIKYEVKRR